MQWIILFELNCVVLNSRLLSSRRISWSAADGNAWHSLAIISQFIFIIYSLDGHCKFRMENFYNDYIFGHFKVFSLFSFFLSSVLVKRSVTHHIFNHLYGDTEKVIWKRAFRTMVCSTCWIICVCAIVFMAFNSMIEWKMNWFWTNKCSWSITKSVKIYIDQFWVPHK